MFYVLLIVGLLVFVIGLHHAAMHDIAFADVFRSEKFRKFQLEGEFPGIVLFTLAGSVGINFVRQVNRLLGKDVLKSVVTGRYHHPVEEERVFMFLDLKGSTSIAEKLGHTAYHRFLNDFFFDISPAVTESGGSIYQYVGDEVVITWNAEEGMREANSITCFFRAEARVQIAAERYRARYAVVPEFKAGLHVGPVIGGEIGDLKTDIVFHGDTVNTAVRIRSECTTYGRSFLMSAEVLRRLPSAEAVTPELIGRIRLRGKETDVELYTLTGAA